MATTYVRNESTGEFELVGPGGATTDTTLSQLGKPADASAVGVALANRATKEYVDTNIASFSNPNLLINGDFQVWQRGETFSNIANKYTADRWLIKNAKGNTSHVEKSTDVPNGQPMLHSIHITETIAENSYLRYAFDGVLKGTFTLSFWYKTNVAFNSYIYDNNVLIHLGKLTTLNNWAKATFTFNATSLSFLNVVHAMSIGDVYITGVKLEYGLNATPFTPKLFAEELALCHRYYFKLQINHPLMTTQRTSASTYTYMYLTIQTPTLLRDTPLISYHNVYLTEGGFDGVWRSISDVTCVGHGSSFITLRLDDESTFKINTLYFLILPDSGYIEFDAEIY